MRTQVLTHLRRYRQSADKEMEKAPPTMSRCEMQEPRTTIQPHPPSGALGGFSIMSRCQGADLWKEIPTVLIIVKVLNVSSYIVQYKTPRNAQNGLPFTSWLTCSIENHLDFSGKHPATLQLRREDYKYTNMRHFCSHVLVYIAE